MPKVHRKNSLILPQNAGDKLHWGDEIHWLSSIADVQVFDHLNCNLTVSFLDEVFIIFYNEYALKLNQRRICGFHFFFFFCYISDNFGCIHFDTHHCPFTLSYRKPVHCGYITALEKKFYSRVLQYGIP